MVCIAKARPNSLGLELTMSPITLSSVGGSFSFTFLEGTWTRKTPWAWAGQHLSINSTGNAGSLKGKKRWRKCIPLEHMWPPRSLRRPNLLDHQCTIITSPWALSFRTHPLIRLHHFRLVEVNCMIQTSYHGHFGPNHLTWHVVYLNCNTNKICIRHVC